MGCVSSTLLNQDEDFPQMGPTSLSHHIVSLTSTTYGLLSLDPPPQTPPPHSCPSPMTPPIPIPRFTLGNEFNSNSNSNSNSIPPKPEVINSWELMAGLDPSTPDNHFDVSFRFSPHLINSNLNSSPSSPKIFKENSNPNTQIKKLFLDPEKCRTNITKKLIKLEQFEEICPPNGENKVVIYTTSLRGVRKTFEDCNAVRSVIQGLGFAFCERDISMDKGFREELKQILTPLKKKNGSNEVIVPPCVFIKGRYIGGSEELLKIHEEGGLIELLQGVLRLEAGFVCHGCGNVRFLPCFRCNGSCKLVVFVKEIDEKEDDLKKIKGDYCCDDGSVKRSVVMRCPDCNENGLVLCPICS